MFRRGSTTRRITSLAGLTVLCLSLGIAPAEAATGAATIAGVLTTAEGAPASGVRVVAEPALANVPLERDETGFVSTATTSAAGAFALTVTPTTDLVNEATGNGGTLNVEVFAVALDYAPVVPTVNETDASSSYYAVGYVQLDLVADATVPGGYAFASPGALALSLSPMQTLVGDGETAVTVNTGSTPEVGASPEAPEDPEAAVADATTTVGLTAENSQQTVDGATGVSSTSVVSVDNSTVNTVTSTVTGATGTSDLLKEVKTYAGDGGGGSDYHTYPSDPCPKDYYGSSGQYYMTYRTYAANNGYIPLAEIHTPSDTNATFTYAQTAKTQIGVAVKASGGGWEIKSSVDVGHSSTGNNTMSFAPRTYRHIFGQFNWHDERKYYCVGSESGSYVRAYWDTRKVDSWTLNLRMGGTDLSGYDTQSRWNTAVSENRGVNFSPNQTVSYSQTTGYYYTAAATVMGVTLGAKSDWVTDVKMSYRFGGAASHRLFGNNTGPLYAKITYCYG